MKTALAIQHRPSATQLLARVLASPDLAAQVQALPAPALARLVEKVGLEDAGEIVALATPTQLADVLDEDLWKSARPGEDERFDVDRFLVWLAVLREGGDELVAARLAELPEELVTLAFHRAVMVVSLDTLMEELGESDDADLTEKALADRLSEEIDVYQVIARRTDGWDDVLAALLALDRDHHDLAMRVLARCEAMTARRIDDEGGTVSLGPLRITPRQRVTTGKVKVVLTDRTGSRTLLSAHGPGTYGYHLDPAFWAPNWQWVAADDGRILVITTGDEPTTRVLVTDRGGRSGGAEGATFAVTAQNLLNS